MSGILRMIRSLAAVLIGYVVMVILITLVQEIWLGGVSYRGSSWGVLFVAGALTFLSAVIGAALAGLIAGRHPLYHAAAMSVLAIIETTYLMSTGKTAGPFWFDILAALSLIAGLLLGGLISGRIQRKRLKSEIELPA